MLCRQIVAVLLVTALCSCAGKIERSEIAAQAKTQLVGMNKEQILSCMGIPARKAAEGETEVWSYSSGNAENTTTAHSTAFGTETSTGNSANAFAVGNTTATTRSRYCIVDIVMRANVVRAVNYSGPTGGLVSKDEQCAYAVKNCQ